MWCVALPAAWHRHWPWQAGFLVSHCWLLLLACGVPLYQCPTMQEMQGPSCSNCQHSLLLRLRLSWLLLKWVHCCRRACTLLNMLNAASTPYAIA